ncbi:hypothetical protein FBU59_004356, partial [Linderina macrospora]
ITTAFLAEHYPSGFKGHRLTAATTVELASSSAALELIRQIREQSAKALHQNVVAAPATASEFVLLIPQLQEDGSVEKIEVTVDLLLASKTVDLQGTNEFTAVTKLPDGSKHKSQLSVAWDVDEPFVEVVKRDGAETTSVTLQYLDPLPLGFRVQYLGTKFDIDVLTPRQRELMKFMKEKEKLDTSKLVLSPMPGTIVSVAVSAGDVVAEGAEVAVVEAMKMQNVLRAPRAGTIKSVHVKQGSTVNGEDILIELEDEK